MACDVTFDPPYLHPEYVATRLRSPSQPLVLLPHTLSELTGPVYDDSDVNCSPTPT